MNKRKTSQDIARLAGVSQSTVSRIIRGLPNVKAETRDRVRAVIAQYAYSPNAAARAMKANRNGYVAVVVENLTNPLYPALLQFLVGTLAKRGFQAIIWETQAELNDIGARAIAESPVDGVIFTTSNDSSILQNRIIANSKPVILMNRSFSTSIFDTVVSDNYAGGAMVARHFIEGSRRRIALLTGNSKASTIKQRGAGFLNALDGSGYKHKCIRSSSDFTLFTYENGYRTGSELFARHPDIDALFCTTDIIAIGALDAARSLGKAIPSDLWIAGYDDIPMAGWDAIRLTTVRQPLESMARLVVERLSARMGEPDLPPYTVTLTNDLIVRATTR